MRTDKENILYIGLLPLASVLTIVLIGLLKKTDTIELFKIGILVFLLTTALMFYVRMRINLLEIKFSKLIIALSYILSLLYIMLDKSPELFSFWMIGGLLISILIDSKLGLLVYFNHTFILSITMQLQTETTIHFLIMGVLFSLLSSYLRNKSTVIYSSIILLSSNITLAFIMNNFIVEESTNTNYLNSLFSIIAVLATAFLFTIIYESLIKKYSLSLEYAQDQTDIELAITDSPNNEEVRDLSSEDTIPSEKINRTSYDVLLSEENELLIKIKERSKALYKHSILIGDLSGRAARVIGADEALARAGGYYHEVGKIVGKNYIEESLILAEEYSFPEELKLILRQHSIKHDKPTSIESAIVMISDNVASTIEYIEKTGDHNFSPEKIIDNIFRMRMEKGTFDDSGLSVKDFKLLKEFYQKEFKVKAAIS